MSQESSSSGSPDLGAMGRSTVLQYWNDMASAWFASGQESSLGWLSIWQDLLLGRANPDRQMDLWRQWTQSFMGLALLPQQWWYQRVQTLPSLVFILDTQAQTSARDQAAPVAIDLGGATLECTDLQALGGLAATAPVVTIPGSSVKARATDDNRRVSVSLVGLGGPPDAPALLREGVYAGVIYSREETVRRPVALVHLFVQPAAHPRL